MFRYLLGALCVACLLTACAAPRQQTATGQPDLNKPSSLPELQRWASHRASVDGVINWNLLGKVGLRSGDRGDTANIIWVRDSAHHRIQIYGPFGGGRVYLELTPKGAVLTDQKERRSSAPSAERLFEKSVGWRVPFDELTWWVKGLPAPGEIYQYQLDTTGRLTEIIQKGWRVTFDDYREWGNVMLPRKIRIVAIPGSLQLVDEYGEAIDDLSVRVVIRDWQFLKRS